ncbi:MAG: chromosomal replication initiator DnaA [Pseudomonadota bacterium]|nr:chromosomal replication initiator DnaA [Pseudomonadota bacterium]
MGRQLRLKLDRALPPTRSEFVVSACNAAAVDALDRTADWPAGALALVGPEGAGKSHLAAIWSAQTPGAVLIEDADRRGADEALFHSLNAASLGAPLLLTGRTRPAAWPTPIADLRSRLNALRVAELDEPDDAVLAAVLSRLFRERSIRPPEDLIPYLIRRIGRSVPEARAVVDRLDEAALAEGRPVTRALAREVLEQTGDLFPS